MTTTTSPKLVIDPNDTEALDQFGAQFWLNQLQPLRGGDAIITDAFSNYLDMVHIEDVARVDIVSGREFGCSAEQTVILSLEPKDETITGRQVLRAVWAGYMLSLKATMDSPRGNGRAHVGDDADAIDLANAIVAELGATATPSDEIYGSCGTFLELLEMAYDHETQILRIDPSIGS